MTDKNIDREIRKRRARERVKTNNPKCLCGETDPRCFEEHHIAQRRYDDATIMVCKNCHAKLSDLQKDHPRPTEDELTPQERFGRMLLGLADILLLIVDKLVEIGEWLIEEARKAIADQKPQTT